MNKLKLAFKVAGSKTATQKALIKLINDSATDFSLEKNLNPILEGIYSYSGTIDGLELYDILLNTLRDCKPRLGVLKTLYICNHIINMIGDSFSKVFLSEFFTNILPPSRTHSTDDLAHGVLAPSYYNFLLMYAKYHGDIQSYKDVNPDAVLAAMRQGNFVPIIQLLTFKNILKYFTTIKGPLEVALGNFKYNGITKKIAFRLFSDAAQMYNMIVKFLNIIIVDIFDMEREMALLVDELYSDMIQITKRIAKFTEVLSKDISDQLPPFEYFLFDPEFNRAEERYILTVKKAQSAQQDQERSFQDTEHLVYLHKYQTFKAGKREYIIDSDIWTATKFSPEKRSIQDLSAQSPSTKSSLVGSLTSPRLLVKKLEYQKSFTTPMTHQRLFITDNIRLPQEIHSARTTRHDDGEQTRRWNNDYSNQGYDNHTETLPDLRESESQQGEANSPVSITRSPKKAGTIAEEGYGSPSSANVSNISNMDWMSPRTKKLKISGLFSKKSKMAKQVIPSMQ